MKPTPGFIIGGPNNNREDDISKSDWGVEYPDKNPAKSYVDHQGSYASNETCINWNAPAVFVLGFLRQMPTN
jgi:endoglucanase